MEWNRIESQWNEMARRLQRASPISGTANSRIVDAVSQPNPKPTANLAEQIGEKDNTRAIF